MIAIVTPVGHERNALPQFLTDLALLPFNFTWIAVFDESSDGGYEWLCDNKPPWCVILQGNGTLGGAYVRGFRESIYLGAEKIIELDIGHPVKTLPEFVSALDTSPVVFGTRYGEGKYHAPVRRRVLSFLGTKISRWLLGLPFSDCTSGYQGFRSHALRTLLSHNIQSKWHFYQTEVKFYLRKCPFAEIPICYTSGKSSLKAEAIWESSYMLWRLFRANRK